MKKGLMNMLERIAKIVGGTNEANPSIKNQPNVVAPTLAEQAEKAPRTQNPIKIATRLASLEETLRAHDMEIAQMKGEYHVEMKYAKTKETRDKLTDTYEALKAEAAKYRATLVKQIEATKKRSEKAQA